MLVEGRECSDVFRTFKRRVVGGSVYPKLFDKQRRLSYNRYLLDIVEHVACLTEKVVVNYKRSGFESWGLVACSTI
jgi:hypothetical protein